MKIHKIAERKLTVKEVNGKKAERNNNSPALVPAVKKSRSIVFAVLAAFILTACSLATEEGNHISGGDRLVGLFITTEYLDTFDWDKVDAADLLDGTVTGRNDRKIYGSFDREKSEYIFEGLEGYSLGIVYVESEDEDCQADYILGIASRCLTDVNRSMGDKDNTCSGVLCYDQTQIGSEYIIYEDESYKDIYKDKDIVVHNVVQENGSEVYEICTDGKELALYANPVYETEDGQIYLVSENGGMMVNAYGGDFTTTISDTTSVTDNGKKNETKNTIEVTYRGAVPALSLKFSWYDKDGKILKESSFQSEKIPESIRWGEETAYILVTLEKTDGTVDYKLIGTEDESYQVYLPSDSLVLESRMVEVER